MAGSDRLFWRLNGRRAAMGGLKSVQELFEGRHFDREVIILCVLWYLRLKLSLRDLVEMMAERGLSWRIRRSCAGYSTARRSSSDAGHPHTVRAKRVEPHAEQRQRISRSPCQ